MSNRWDAAQEWIRRRTAKYEPEGDRCPKCRPTVTRADSGREYCWRTASHIAKVFGLTHAHAGQEVRNAAIVLNHVSWDAIRGIENDIERMIHVHRRLYRSGDREPHIRITGTELLKIVRRLLTANEHNANR